VVEGGAGGGVRGGGWEGGLGRARGVGAKREGWGERTRNVRDRWGVSALSAWRGGGGGLAGEACGGCVVGGWF